MFDSEVSGLNGLEFLTEIDETTKNLKQLGMDNETIVQVTGLTVEEIRRL